MLANRPPARSSDQKESDREKIVHRTTGSKLQQVQQLYVTEKQDFAANVTPGTRREKQKSEVRCKYDVHMQSANELRIRRGRSS